MGNIVPNIELFKVEIFDELAGKLTSFHSDLNKVKGLPVQFEKDKCLPNKIDVRTFIFNSDIYDSTSAMICGALNRDTLKVPKLILTWSSEDGWTEI